MSSYRLKLCPYHGRDIEFELSDEPGMITLKHCSVHSNLSVRSDFSYSAELFGDFLPEEYDVCFYVNGEEVSVKQNGGKLSFVANQGRIFLSNIGLVQISVEIISGSEAITLYSDYFPILVRNNTVNRSVQHMAEYVYRHQEDFLLKSKMPSRMELGIKPDSPKELESQIQIIGKIIQIYSEEYQYFASNAKFQLKSEGRVDDFEKIQKVTSSTLTYIAQHPEQLLPVNRITGIRKHGRQYIPRKVMVVQNKMDYDTYENRSIVNFLKTVYLSIGNLIEEIDYRIDAESREQAIPDGYFNSAWFIIEVSRRKMIDYRLVLKEYESKIEKLYISYSAILLVSKESVVAIPRPTPVFMSIPAYRLIYNQIVEWFRYGIYYFEREDFMLPFMQSHKLYEYYILIKLHAYIQRCGFEYQKVDAIDYPDLRYLIASKNNTFYYYSDRCEKTITLYYEPAIYGKTHVGYNSIGLFRNTSRKYNGVKDSVPYYTPDYVIKVDENNQTKYVVMDAKFSSSETIKKTQQSELIYKYLFSLSTIRPSDKILGMCLFSGKSDDIQDSAENIYDLASRVICPFAEILTLTENVPNNDEMHFQLLDGVLEIAD